MSEATASYEFDEDALGLGQFIQDQFEAMGDDVSPVVYVEDGEGRAATKAEWIVRTLTDGTKVAELRITFD